MAAIQEQKTEKRYAIFEDEHEVREQIMQILGMIGYTLAVEAGTMLQADELIPSLEQLGVKAAIVDGNLTASRSNEDGVYIVNAIKKTAPSVRTIGYSGSGSIEGADFNIDKDSQPRVLIDVFENIFNAK